MWNGIQNSLWGSEGQERNKSSMGKLLSIVIHNNHIRIAELSNGRNGVTVTRLITREMPENLVGDSMMRDVKGFSELLVSILRYANIKTKKAVFSIPADKAMTREVILPDLGEEKIKTTLKANASEYFPIDLSEYVLGYFPLSRILPEEETEEGKAGETEEKKKKRKTKKKSRPQLRMMVVAVPSEAVQSYFDLAKLSHLKLVSVDYMGNSVFQLTESQIDEKTSLVIQLDEEHTVLTMYDDNIMVFQRQVDFGSMSVVQAVMEERHCEYEEAEKLLETQELIHDNFDDSDQVTDSLYYLISNIKRVIEYYTGRNSDNPLEQVYIMGDGSMINGLAQLLTNQLMVPTETLTTLKKVIVKDGSGISMKEILKYMDNIGAVIAPVNFLPKELEQDIRHKLEVKAYRVMILLALFASLVIVTVPAMNFFSTAMEALELKNKLLVMEDVKPMLENYRQASTRYEDVTEVQSLTRTDNESLVTFIRLFEQLRPSNISLTEFECKEGEVSFSALAGGKKIVVKLIQQLNMIANVSEVKVSSLESSFEGGVETVSFSVTCKLTNADTLLGGSLSPGEDSGEISGESLEESSGGENGARKGGQTPSERDIEEKLEDELLDESGGAAQWD